MINNQLAMLVYLIQLADGSQPDSNQLVQKLLLARWSYVAFSFSWIATQLIMISSGELKTSQLARCLIWQLVQIVLFQRNSKQEGFDEDIPFCKIPWNFQVCHFTLRNSRQNKASPLEIPQNYVIPLGNFKAKNQDPWKFHVIFSLVIPENSTPFLIHTWNFHILFLQYLWKFHVLNTPLPHIWRFS